MSVTAVLLGLALTTATPVDDAPEGKKYELSFEGTTADLAKGGSGTFALAIKPAPGFKVSNEAPLKIKLASEGLALKKTALSTGDATEKGWTQAPAFAVGFAADKEGQQAIQVDATFFVCDVRICERKTEKVSVPVSVRQ
jgi:hypothetical protein